jgi:hypothetical protein
MNWISVKNQMPKAGQMVIVTVNTTPPCTSISEHYFDGWAMLTLADEHRSDSPLFSDYDMEITHWMPLPEPCKENAK